MNLTHYDNHGGGGGVGLNEPTPSTSSGYLGLDNNSHPNYYADDSSDEYPISNYHILESQPQLYQQQQQQQHQQQQHQQQQQPSTSFNSTAFNPNYHHHHHLPQTYYEPPLFQPPPSSSYYSPHQYSQIPILQPPPPPPPSLIQSTFPAPHLSSWYQTPAVNQQRDQMLNMLQFSNSTNGREARNRAEKNRRDKLNGSIHELSTMVPHVAESPRRVDKTAVLRFSAHGLRVHYVFGKTINTPPKVKPQVTDSLMKLLDSFLLTVTCHGQIVLVSPSIEQHLGHCQTDLFGQNISHITHPDDREMLKKQLIPTGLETLFDIQPEDERGEPRPRTKDEEEEIDRKLREDKRNFTLRLARAGPRSEPITYEIVKIDGCFRRADSAPRGVKASTFPSGLQLIRRARGRDDSIPLHTISGNDIVLVAMARVIKPPKICERLLEANNYEYKTRHLIDGRIIQCDQRISLVAGYMTEEVNGLSPFTFMHQDDVRWVIVALRQMYDCNSSYGESCYRLITRTGKFVFLRTRGYLEIDKDTNKVHSFVCINTLVSEDEGRRRVREMKNKFSIIINTKVQQSAIDAPASENPHQLERAIIYLIQNLENSNRHIDNVEQNSKRDGSESDTSRQSKSPPLAIIPPKPSTIKSSIAKSMTVVNATAGKNLHNIQAHDKIKTSSTTSKTINNNSNNNNENVGNLTRPSVVQKSGSSRNKISEGNNNNNSQVTDSILVKEDDSYSEESDRRVPPLPNSKDYFEMSTSTIDISFSIEDDPVTTELLLNEPVVCQQTSVLKRTHFSNEIDDDDDDDDSSMSIPKRRNLETENIVSPPPPYQETIDPASDLTEILPSTFGAIDRSLLDIENVTNELKGQCKTYSVDQSSAYKLEEIIEEHQEQREMLENIQNEFHARIHSTGPTTSTNLTTNIQENENGSSKNDLKPR